jgi:hypothetical protein
MLHTKRPSIAARGAILLALALASRGRPLDALLDRAVEPAGAQATARSSMRRRARSATTRRRKDRARQPATRCASGRPKRSSTR